MKEIKALDRLEQLRQAKGFVDGGGFHTTPFAGMPKLTREFGGGVIPGKLYAITADTAGGKTKFVKALLFAMWRNYKQGIGKNYKVIFFALEESYEEFIDSVFITFYEIYYEKQILECLLPSINYPMLNSLFKTTLPEEVFDAMLKLTDYVQDFMDKLIMSNISNPTGMYKFCKEQLEIQGYGKHKYYTKDIDGQTKQIYDGIEKTDSNTQFIVIVDHLSALKSEQSKNDTKHSTMEKWVANYAKNIITEQWGWTCIDILQQMFDPDRGASYNQRDEVIVRRVEPSLEKLGNNKEIARYYYVILGLFNPYYYRIKEYPKGKYDITTFEDNFRCAIILKNRYGLPGKKIPFYFYGNSFFWKEMPPLLDDDKPNIELAELIKKHNLLTEIKSKNV